MTSPAPIRPTVSDVQAWRDALEAMKPTTAPCPGITGAKLEEMRTAAIDFLKRFGDNAVALGWTVRTCSACIRRSVWFGSITAVRL